MLWVIAAAVWLLSTAPAVAVEITVVGGGDGFSDPGDLEQFYEAHPDIRISILSAGNDQVLAMLAAGNAPDLIRVEARQVPFWVAKGLLEDLTPYIEKQARFITPDDLVPVNDLYVLDGRRYALNKDWSADLTIYYNKDLFDGAGLAYPSEDAPLTYAEVLDLSRKIASSEPGQLQRWGFSTHYAPLSFQGMLRSAGVPLYSEDQTEVVLTEHPETLRIAEWWVEMGVREWYAHTDVSAVWHQGRLGILQSGFWFGPVAAIGGTHNTMANEATQSGTTEPIGFAPAPVWGDKRVNLAVATGFAMFADSQHKDAAWQVLEWFMVGPPAVRRTRIGWGIPPMRSLFEHIPMETEFDRQRYRVTVGEMPYLTSHYENRYDANAFDAAWRQWYPGAAGQQFSANEFLLRVQHETNQLLARAAGR